MAERATSLRERKKQKTRQRILDTAIELFQDHGFNQTSVDEIASRADVSRATCFNYFPNKESILREIAVQELEQLQQLAGDERPDPPVARIRQVMRRLVADTLPYLRITRYIILGAMLYPSDENAFNIRLGNILGTLVQEAQRRGEIRSDLSPTEVAHAITGIYLAVVFERITHHDAITDASSSVERIVDMVFQGLAGPNYTPLS